MPITALQPNERLIQMTTLSEGVSGCVVHMNSARPIADSIAADAETDPDILKVEIVEPDGSSATVFEAA